MTTQGERYQGYPYVKPAVIDAPTLNPDEVAARGRWANLPVRQIRPGLKRIDQPSVVYIDLPETSAGSQVTNGPSPTAKRDRPGPKEDEHVVYIDIPQSSGGSQLSERTESSEPAFVQETIFYDPFKDRRIDIRADPGSDHDSGAEAQEPAGRPHRPLPTIRPEPPFPLDLETPASSSTSSQNYIPPSLSKEAYLYGRQPTQDDGFPLSPIPVSEFPRPPPAYEEIESQRTPQSVDSQDPPRTQVIIATPSTPNAPIVGLPHANRKYLTCQHCGTAVHTLMLRENGLVTHLMAILVLMFCLLPVVFIIYCTTCCKYKTHYCPNCNKKIGHELPILCQGLVYDEN